VLTHAIGHTDRQTDTQTGQITVDTRGVGR